MKTSAILSMVGGACVVTAAGALIAANLWVTPAANALPAKPESDHPAAAASGTFAVDNVHSSVVFKIKHMGVSNFYGVFKDVDGTFTFSDTADLKITVKADSVDTRNAKRDEHVKGPDFFSAKEFPTMTFSAKALKKDSAGAYAGSGDLTFRGVTKPVSLAVHPTGSAKGHDGKPIAGFETKVTIKRSDFGNTGMIGPLSDEVDIIVAIEGAAK